ncbi:MAG: glycosyltransferase family 2 protein [Opitutales bacterium]
MPLLEQLTTVVPCKNEEKNIGECLKRLQGFCRCVVADSGSTDRTAEIAESYGATVLQFDWDGKFPKKRNWVLRTHPIETEWVLFLDTDEFAPAAFLAELEATLPETGHNGFWIEYDNFFMGKLQRHGVPMRKLALFRVGKGAYEYIPESSWSQCDMEVHEHAIVEGSVGEISTRVVHHDLKDLTSLVARHNNYSSWEAHRFHHLMEHKDEKWHNMTLRQRTKYRLLSSFWAAPFYFMLSYVVKRGFLDGISGFRFSLFKAYYFFQIYLKIRELRQAPKSLDAESTPS